MHQIKTLTKDDFCFWCLILANALSAVGNVACFLTRIYYMQQYKFYTVLYRNYLEVNIGTLEQK